MPLKTDDEDHYDASNAKSESRWRCRFWILAGASTVLLIASWSALIWQVVVSSAPKFPYCK